MMEYPDYLDSMEDKERSDLRDRLYVNVSFSICIKYLYRPIITTNSSILVRTVS